MPKKFHLNSKSAPARFVTPGPTGIIEGDGCLNCANCVKKFCVYSVYRKRDYDSRQMFDTADALCKNCFRCVQGCYGRVLSKSRNPEFWFMGDEYWTPEIIASNQSQAETGKIPVSGGGYGGLFAGTGFDSMWTDMSEIVRPTRDGIHGREYISTAMELGRIPKKAGGLPKAGSTSSAMMPEGGIVSPRVEISVPMIFDLPPLGEYLPVPLAMARAAQEVNTLMVIPVAHLGENLWPFASHLVPLLPDGNLEKFRPAISRVRMVQIPLDGEAPNKIREIKKINPGVVVSVRIPLTPKAKEEAESLERSGVEVIHFVADEKGREHGASSPRFIKEVIREVHLHLGGQRRRDEVTLIFGGGIAMAEHVAKAIICGADAVSVARPLLVALECRLCGRCSQGMTCPVELEKINSHWGRQRIVNLIAAWHGQLLEVLGAMGLRDVRRLRGEVGRAIFLEDIEKETFGRIFGAPLEKCGPKENEGGVHVLAS